MCIYAYFMCIYSDVYLFILIFNEVCKIVIIYVYCILNTLTVNYEYSRNNRENLPLPIQIKLSKKP